MAIYSCCATIFGKTEVEVVVEFWTLPWLRNWPNKLPKNAITGDCGNLIANKFENTANSKSRQIRKAGNSSKHGERQIRIRLNREVTCGFFIHTTTARG